MRRLVLLGALAALLPCASAGAQLPRLPIPGPLDAPLPRYSGAPVSPQPLPGPFVAATPFLAPDGRSGSGLSAGNGAASPLPGPLGHATQGVSSLQFGTCASLAFDRADRLLAVCNGLLGPTLRLIDPRTLAALANIGLPIRPNADRADLAGGTHLVVKADGTVLVPTHDRKLLRVSVDGTKLVRAATTDLAALLAPGERPFAVSVGYDATEWVVGNAGTVVALPAGAAPRALALGAPVSEDVAADPQGGLLVASAGSLARVRWTGGAIAVDWRVATPTATTPPVVLPDGLVAFGSSTAVHAVRLAEGERLCDVPVFTGAARVTAHLVAAGSSVVVSNGHGYDSPLVTEGGRTTTGGLTRIDLGDGCRVAWTSREISPSAQPVVSRATGLLYTLVKPAGFPDAWNLAAIDWRTGATRFAALAGEGLGHNSEGGAIALGPDGSAYAGTFGGVVRFSG